jgi:hypothetical protein
MTVQYGDICMSQREVYGWMERFRRGRTIADACSGRTWTVTRDEVKIYQRIRENRRISINEIASEMSNLCYEKKRCKNGVRHSRKYFSLMKPGNLTIRLNALKTRQTE